MAEVSRFSQNISHKTSKPQNLSPSEYIPNAVTLQLPSISKTPTDKYPRPLRKELFH